MSVTLGVYRVISSVTLSAQYHKKGPFCCWYNVENYVVIKRRIVHKSEMYFSLLVQHRQKEKDKRYKYMQTFFCVDEVCDFGRSVQQPPPTKRRRERSNLTCRKKRGRMKHITFINNISVVFSLGLL